MAAFSSEHLSLQAFSQMLPYERVRYSCAEVLKRAEHVKLNSAAISKMAKTIEPSEVLTAYRWDNGVHYIGDTQNTINYIFSVDTVNFGSGFSPLWKATRSKSTYMTVANALKDEMLSGATLDAQFAKDVSGQDLAKILKVEPDFPLIPMFTRALNEIGNWVLAKFGSYINFLESLPKQARAAALIEALVSNLSCFNDVADYRNLKACFYKRAQILVNDLSLALNAKDLGFFPDLDQLTMFADNLLAHVFWVDGVLEYTPVLVSKIQAGELLAPGSSEEVEMRAASVKALELLTQEVNQQNSSYKIFPAMLDNYLWNKGQAPTYKQYPRHLTHTYFY